jgi:hypothetical protein
MNKTIKADMFRDVFKNSLKINARSLSVKTLLSERNLKRINFNPYYQRNYVWDKEKQTFFIESVILGTEVPPLILFKSGSTIEVIDGRQRFETLKKFKEDDLTLSSKGLKELQLLSKKSFNKLGKDNQDTFLESNIRVFEFEVINHPDLSDQVIDKVKKEIFRRYNTGITPLTRDELDSAKYDTDTFSDLFKEEFKNNFNFLQSFNLCFFGKSNLNKEESNASLISKNIDFIRRYRILKNFPITTYAGSSNRTEIINLLYDFSNNNSDDINSEFSESKLLIDQVLKIHHELKSKFGIDNKLLFETILWAISILHSEGIEYSLNAGGIEYFYSMNLSSFVSENSHYYKNIITRHKAIAEYFKAQTKFNFTPFIRDTEFSSRVKQMRKTDQETSDSIEELSNLRLHKPNPTSVPIDEIRNDLKSTSYMLRPSYQRQEKINELKASSIIESILLGITLPPIFIYKRIDGIKEVVDGQQRLLSIIGFLGDEFFNENKVLTRSKNNNLKLKGLRILTDLEGSRFSDLTHDLQDKILDFVIDLIVIEESMNELFDPIDLFIRLNYKPYPIKANSFELWNSIVDPEVVKNIKEICNSDLSEWFFLREKKEGKPDRMLNEELITALSYILYKKKSESEENVIGFFPRKETITCRLKDKKGLNNFLIELDNTALDRELFLDAINTTVETIKLIPQLFDKPVCKDAFTDFLNVKGNPTFRRSLQDFYMVWLVLIYINPNKLDKNKKSILNDMNEILKLRVNTGDKIIDARYVENFEKKLKLTQKKYQ